jgi:endoglucanase
MRAGGIFGVIVVLAIGMLVVQPSVAALAVPPQPAPTPVVSGTHLLDSRTGATFAPHGANWPSFEYSCTAVSGHGWSYSGSGATKAAADAMASWDINIVRIPLNQDCWLGANPTHNFGTAAGYQAAVLAWVNILRADGIAVILDLHWSAPAGKLADGQYAMPDAQSIPFWKSVGAAYASDPSVIFDAFNEPYSTWNMATGSYAFNLTWDCWENGGCQAPDTWLGQATDGRTYTAVGMSALVAAIRSSGATQPIMLGGLAFDSDLSQWYAHKPNDSQLIASWHNYQNGGCVTASCWNYEISVVGAHVPVIAGELGESDGGSSFLTAFMSWADTHSVGYLPWAWWDVTGGAQGSYALYTGTNFTPKYPSGTTYRSHLVSLAVQAP